jgi:hypothetical protein
MKTVKIDLAEKGPCCAPPQTMEDKKYYPTIHISGDKEIDFPHDGKMTVVFHKTNSSVSEHDGKKHYSCTLEIREIVEMDSAEAESEGPSYKDAEKSLDALMAEHKKLMTEHKKVTKESY